MIILTTLLTLVFIVIKMLYNIPHQINLEDYILKNCIGMISFITILRKIPILFTSPDGIIKSINTFINNTNNIAETFMDGKRDQDINQNIDINGTTNEIKLNNDIIESKIIKSFLEKIINRI